MLSILCVSRVNSDAVLHLGAMSQLAKRLGAEFVIAADGSMAFDRAIALGITETIARVKSSGYIESVLDDALRYCHGEYVLRLDDDERVSPAMLYWLEREEWRASDHWEFPRMHVWGNEILMMPQLYPDYQTRLSTRLKAGGRTGVHAGSPFGGGQRAPVALMHYKFEKAYETRLGIAEKYDAYCPGYGTGNMIPFSLPEDAYKGQIVYFAPMWDGSEDQMSSERRTEQW